MKQRITTGLVLGFVAGLAVAIACSAKSMSGSRGTDAGVVADAVADSPTPTAPDRLRVRTADTDIDQQDGGETTLIPSTADAVVATGPVIITDIWTPEITSISGLIISLHSNATCDAPVAQPRLSSYELVGARVLPLHGVRLALKAGEFLCARSTGAFAVQWSGYRPYPSN